jgi:citrate synthase
MRKAKPLRSEMGWSSRVRITVRGFDLTKNLLGKIDLGAMAGLEITGRLPDAREAEVFNALLVTLVEHGMTPQAISTRLIIICAPEAMQAAVAAGLLGVGSVFAGGSEETARVLQAALAGKPADADLGAIAGAVVEDNVVRKAPIRGLGHPVHKPIDPRTPVLFAIAGKNGYRGRYVALLEAICAAAEVRLGRSLPINATGAIGAILSEFSWAFPGASAVASRSSGAPWGSSAISPRKCATRSATKSTSASSTR